MLQRLPEETAELCRRENRGRMTLTSGSAGYSVDVWDLGAFPKPDLPFPEDTVKVSGMPSIKGLYWEKDGFILLYKRLEQGAYQWPRSESEVKTLTPQQYRWLMEGLQIEQPKAHRPVTGLTTV